MRLPSEATCRDLFAAAFVGYCAWNVAAGDVVFLIPGTICACVIAAYLTCRISLRRHDRLSSRESVRERPSA